MELTLRSGTPDYMEESKVPHIMVELPKSPVDSLESDDCDISMVSVLPQNPSVYSDSHAPQYGKATDSPV